MKFSIKLTLYFLFFTLSPCVAQPGGGGPPGGGEPVPLQGIIVLILGGIFLVIKHVIDKKQKS
jgi:hypothetical protein